VDEGSDARRQRGGGQPLRTYQCPTHLARPSLPAPDLHHRLAQIAGATAEGKREHCTGPARVLQRWMVPVISRKRLVYLLVDKLPA
jgi:hypothetical protein